MFSLPINDRIFTRSFLSGNGKLQLKGDEAAWQAFGVGAGGNVEYGFLRRVPADTSARKVLKDLFAQMQLPQQTIEASRIPAPGDVASTRLGGYLTLRGYSMSGTKSLDIRDLKLDLDYALKLAASVSFGYKLAGDFEIEARRGHDDGWARYSWYTGCGKRTVELDKPARMELQKLFLSQGKYVKRLGKLDEKIDQARQKGEAVPTEDLRKASKQFIAMADNLEEWRENAFFALFDGLVHLEAGSKARRESVLKITILPPGAKEKVRKILQAGKVST